MFSEYTEEITPNFPSNPQPLSMRDLQLPRSCPFILAGVRHHPGCGLDASAGRPLPAPTSPTWKRCSGGTDYYCCLFSLFLLSAVLLVIYYKQIVWKVAVLYCYTYSASREYTGIYLPRITHRGTSVPGKKNVFFGQLILGQLLLSLVFMC